MSIGTLQQKPSSTVYGADDRGPAPGAGMALTSRPHACVIDHCVFGRAGMASLVAEGYAGEVSSLSSGLAYQQLPLAEQMRPVSLLVYRLPTTLLPLLEAVCFLRAFLTPREEGLAGPRPRTRVIVLTDLPSFWLYDTLRSAWLQDEALLSVSVLPAYCRPQQLRTVLTGMLPNALLVHQALKTPVLRRARGLSTGEVEMLRWLLAENLSISEQAWLRKRSIKTLYSQRLSAMRKLGVRSLPCLLRWSVRPRRGQP